MGTLYHRVSNRRELRNRNGVKVVTDTRGCALHFSRSAIPYGKATSDIAEIDGVGALWYKHVGIWTYRRRFLLRYPILERFLLEDAEGLEPSRIFEHGYEIRVYPTEWETLGIDTEEDLFDARRRCKTDSRQRS